MVTRIVGRPVKFEVVPIEKALDSLVLEEIRESKEKITRLYSGLEELKKEIKEYQEQRRTQKDSCFLLITKDMKIRNKFDIACQKCAKEFCLVHSKIGLCVIKMIIEQLK